MGQKREKERKNPRLCTWSEVHHINKNHGKKPEPIIDKRCLIPHQKLKTASRDQLLIKVAGKQKRRKFLTKNKSCLFSYQTPVSLLVLISALKRKVSKFQSQRSLFHFSTKTSKVRLHLFVSPIMILLVCTFLIMISFGHSKTLSIKYT